jgi:hypothetical protein
MSNCATPLQLQQLGESAVAQFDARIAELPQGFCFQFQIEAMRLQDQLLFIHSLVVLCAKDEDELGSIASYWEFMVGMCDRFANSLFRLKELHPACGADQYYDRILDLRNKCKRLQEMHQ